MADRAPRQHRSRHADLRGRARGECARAYAPGAPPRLRCDWQQRPGPDAVRQRPRAGRRGRRRAPRVATPSPRDGPAPSGDVGAAHLSCPHAGGVPGVARPPAGLRRPVSAGVVRRGDCARPEPGRGSIEISVGNIVEFLLTLWLAYVISAFIRFVLREDVFPRSHLTRGISYAISSLLNYVIVAFGLLLALGALGLDLTKVTVLAGAFGVGIGFGLQSVVNNLVSGLILLFERPVHV